MPSATRTALGDLTWPEAQERGGAGAVLVVPVGATEQHGPHLPLSTDTDIALALCAQLQCPTGTDVIVAPAVAYGSSGEHAGFAGTISIGQEALELMLVELGRSATETFQRVLYVSAHGGNAGPVHQSVETLRAEGRDVRMFVPAYDGDLHAGHSETSIQLALEPRRVRADAAVLGDTRELADLMPTLRSQGVRAVSASGVLGDPTRASASHGQQLLDQLGEDLADFISNWPVPAGHG